MSLIDLAIKWAGPILRGQVRHILTGAAGALVAAGALQGDQQTQFVTIGSGVVVYLGTVAFSAWEKIEKGEAWEKALSEAFAAARPVVNPNDPKNAVPI